jgi:hypothetical protein
MMISCKVAAVTAVTGFTIGTVAPTTCLLGSQHKNGVGHTGCLTPKADMCAANIDVRFGSQADICSANRHVRFAPNSDRKSGYSQKVMSASPPKVDMRKQNETSALGQKRTFTPQSMTSSERACSAAGTFIFRLCAALRLITSWKVVGWMTGRSAGLSPFRIRPE